MPNWYFSKPRIPLRAAILAGAALVVPFVDTTFRTGETSPNSALLWLLALVPAFLLAYYRGWRGVATALAAGMVVLTCAVCIAITRGSELRPDLLLPVIAIYIAIALATGWLSERLHDERANAEMLALTDELTGLPNRRRSRPFLESQISLARHGRALSVVMFDLDRFKGYNDRNGHPAGDVMLRTFANVLRASLVEGDLAVRYGGEEFLAVLSDCGEQDAIAFAERVRGALRTAQNGTDEITVSAGIATFGKGLSTANDLIIAADRALYDAKQRGRDQVCIATQLQSAVLS